MRRVLLLQALGLSLLVACGGSGTATSASGGSSSTTGTMASSTTSSGAGGMTGGSVPSPGAGDNVDNAFDNTTVANNTPATALPLGTSTSTTGLNVWVDGNSIGSAGDTENYFVFESGPAAQQMTFDICFQAPVTAMTATLWKVANHEQVMPAIGTWQSASGCVTTQAPNAPASLEASTEYLFGLTATATGVGMYAA